MRDWTNIDLESPSERDAHLIDPLTFNTLLLEIGCNLRDINEKTVTEQFETDLQGRIDEARQVFRDNLANITKAAQKERESR